MTDPSRLKEIRERAEAVGYERGRGEEWAAVLKYLDTAKYTGPRSDFVLTSRDNVKSLRYAYDIDDTVVMDVALFFREAIQRGEHVSPLPAVTGKGG